MLWYDMRLSEPLKLLLHSAFSYVDLGRHKHLPVHRLCYSLVPVLYLQRRHLSKSELTLDAARLLTRIPAVRFYAQTRANRVFRLVCSLISFNSEKFQVEFVSRCHQQVVQEAQHYLVISDIKVAHLRFHQNLIEHQRGPFAE